MTKDKKIRSIVFGVLSLLFFFGLILVSWNGWRHYQTGTLSTTYLTVFILLLVGSSLFFWAYKRFDSEFWACGCLIILALGLLIWALAFAPKNWIQKKSSSAATQRAMPTATEKSTTDDVLLVSINMSKEKFQQGEAGEIVFTLINIGNPRGNMPVETGEFEINLPLGFSNGFVIDYPQAPYCAISERQEDIIIGIVCKNFSVPESRRYLYCNKPERIICDSVIVPEYETLIFSIPVFAKEIGNYDGEISFKIIDANLITQFEESEYFRIIVLPRSDQSSSTPAPPSATAPEPKILTETPTITPSAP